MLDSLFAYLNTHREQSRRSKRRESRPQFEVLEDRQVLAAIAWSSGDITGDDSVSTNGTSVFALSGSGDSGSSVSVNGVSFLQSTRGNARSLAQTQSPGNESITTTLGHDNTQLFDDGGLGAVGDIIRGGWWGADSGDSAEVTLSGLTIGDNYEVQIFSNDSRNGRDQDFITRIDDGNGGAGIDLALSQGSRSAGDFGIGVFTADATTQSFELTGLLNGGVNEGRIHINAIQLRNLGAVELLPGARPLINEFSASNNGILNDDNGNSTDWIEIYNAGEDSVNLSGYTLTDDPTEPSKYVFPDTTLIGGQYLVVFAGDDADPTSGSDLYTGFGLSRSGDYLGFFDPAGELVSEFGPDGTDYPEQTADVSYGLVADGNFDTPSFFARPTPRSANANAIDGVVGELPTVSVARGFYDEAFDVVIAAQANGESVVYTTDGSEPSLANGTRVDPSNDNSAAMVTLTISETTSLRTTAVREGFLSSGSTTHTYVFLDDVISSSVLDTDITEDYTNAELRAGLLDIPTLSFNYENEITSSFVPEQPVSVEWLAPDGSEGFQIDAGISGFGGFFTNFQKKNFRVEFRSEYGASQLEFPLFEGFDNGIAATTSFDSLDFRSGSHDRIQRGFGLSNRFVDDTLMEAGHVVPHGRFVHIYNNGVYWGQYHMRERWDADFLSQYYGGEEDDYEAVNGNVNNGNSTPNGWSVGEIYDGDGTAWLNISALADLDGSGNPTGGYQELKEAVDLPQYIDYLLVYMAGNSENEYRSGGTSDGAIPYTFTLNDADGWLRSTSDRTGNAGPANIFGTLVDEGDPEFLTLLADRIENMFGDGGVLSPERATERLQTRIDETENSFVLESARWSSIGEARTPQSFENAANSALRNMLPNVGSTMIANFRARGLFPDADAPSFNIGGEFQNGGAIASGDVLTLDAGNLIYYTTDGTDPRLEGGDINPNAIAYDPATVSTTIFANGSDWNYLDDGSNQGTAWRSVSFDDSSWETGASELGYGDDPATTVSYGDDDDDKHITTYFRKTFDVTEDFDTATLDIFYDDAPVVYLNGTEVGRANINGTVNWQTRANSAISNGTTAVFDISDFLVVGSNTLAVEIHQVSPTSSDISFNASLRTTAQLGNVANIPLTASTNIQARAFDGEWSAIRNATFVIPAPQSDLRISELHFNPADPTTEIEAGFNNDDFEFIEIFNPNTASSINLDGVQLVNGVRFDFDDFDLLPGERAVIVEDRNAFIARYGDSATILGEWGGALSNNGEEITLLDSSMNEIMSVNYTNEEPWYSEADGEGFSLVLDDPANTPINELGQPQSWRPSTDLGGTPGEAPTETNSQLVGDADGDDNVSFADFLILASNFGTAQDAIFSEGDFDEDGDIDFVDFLLLAGNFGAQAE